MLTHVSKHAIDEDLQLSIQTITNEQPRFLTKAMDEAQGMQMYQGYRKELHGQCSRA